MELENIILSKINQAQKYKIVFSPPYEEHRPKTNAVILLDMGFTLREDCTWER
jgi:hypothetical protein